MKKAVLRRKTGTELPKATPIPNSTGKATMTKLPYATGKTAAKNASKGVTNRTVKTPSTMSGDIGRNTATVAKKPVVNRTPTASSISGATRPTGTATRGTALKAGTITNNAPKAFVNSKTPTMSSYASKSGATRKKPY